MIFIIHANITAETDLLMFTRNTHVSRMLMLHGPIRNSLDFEGHPIGYQRCNTMHALLLYRCWKHACSSHYKAVC